MSLGLISIALGLTRRKRGKAKMIGYVLGRIGVG